VRHRLLPLAVVASLAACSSGADDTTSDATTPRTTLARDECDDLARAAVAPLQEFVDRYDGMMVAEWNALDPPPDVGPVQDDVAAQGRAAVAEGCDPATIEAGIAAAVAQLDSDGEVGAAIVAALNGEELPATSEAGPASDAPERVLVRSGDDVVDILDDIAAGSTLEFAAGVHEIDQTIVIESAARLEGADRTTTTIRSSAEGAALVFLGAGSLEIEGLTVEHVGDAPASVMLAIGGPVNVTQVALRGAVAGDGGAGGHGLVYAFEPLDGFPELTPAERAGDLVVSDSEIVDNASAGVLVTGDAEPVISGSLIARNGECGLCYRSESGGSVVASTIEGNRIGAQIEGDATPTIAGGAIVDNVDVGLSIDGGADVSVTGTEIARNGDVGVQLGGRSTPRLEENTIEGQSVGVIATDDVAPVLRGNLVTGGDFGLQVDGRVVLDVVDNRFRSVASAALRLDGASTGRIRGNVLEGMPLAGIQVDGDAAPDISGTTISGAGEVGLSFAGNSAGSATGNSISGRDIGVQVAGRAAPVISGNTIVDSAVVGILYGEEAAGTATRNEIGGADSFRIVVGGNSTPEVTDNDLKGGEVVRDPAT
jgi:hypothetical protein